MLTVQDLLAVRVGNNRPLSVFEATMRMAGEAMENLNASAARPSEETLTSSLIGLVVGTFPWCVVHFGPDDVPGTTCEWAQFNKNGSGPDAESRRGADFALILRMPGKAGETFGKVRVALFQAKSDASASIADGKIKLHHGLKGKTSDGRALTQMEVLFDFACHMLNRNGNRSAGIQHLHWVHYLGQMKDGVRCQQLKNLEKEFKIERHSSGGDNLYVMPDSVPTFASVLLDATEDSPRYWQDFDPRVVEAMLPDLLELMGAWVGEDGRGGGGLGLSLNGRSVLSTQPVPPNPAPRPRSLPGNGGPRMG